MRAGLECDDATGCVVPPLHLTSTFAFRGFGEKRAYDYTRSGNPTRDLLGAGDRRAGAGRGRGGHRQRHGGDHRSSATSCRRVARIIAPHDCYGGTYRLFDAWRRAASAQVEFVDFGDEAAVRAALSQARGAAVDRDARATRCCASPTSTRSPRSARAAVR